MADDFEDYKREMEAARKQQTALAICGNSYGDEIDFIERINECENLPQIAKDKLFGLVGRTILYTNFSVCQIKSERARCDEVLAQIRFYMPPGRLTADTVLMLSQIKMLHNAILAGAYDGFTRKQLNTKFAHVTTDRDTQPEKEKGGLRKMLGF